MKSTLLDYDQVAATSAPLPPALTWRAPIIRLSGDDIAAFISKTPRAEDGWTAFRNAYPDAGGLLTLSKVGLSSDRTQAVVSVSWTADALAGKGEIWFLQKTAEGWQPIYKLAAHLQGDALDQLSEDRDRPGGGEHGVARRPVGGPWRRDLDRPQVTQVRQV